jgi:hypothetical protein
MDSALQACFAPLGRGANILLYQGFRSAPPLAGMSRPVGATAYRGICFME